MSTYERRLGPCHACNQRAMAEFQCARVAELLMMKMAPVDYFDRMLHDMAELYVIAAETHPMKQEFIN